MYAEHDSLPSSSTSLNSTSRASKWRCPFCWIGSRRLRRGELSGGGASKSALQQILYPRRRDDESPERDSGPSWQHGALGKVRAAQRSPRKRALRERVLR